MKVILGFCAAILVGCTTTPAPTTSTGRVEALDGSVWELPDANAGRPVTLEFRGRDGGGLAVGGYDGCNRFNGAAELGDADAIRFPTLALTRMACLGNTAAIERRVMAALEATRILKLEGTELRLLGSDGQMLLTYRRQ